MDKKEGGGIHDSLFKFMDRECSILVLYFMDWEDFHISPLILWMGKISILVLDING